MRYLDWLASGTGLSDNVAGILVPIRLASRNQMIKSVGEVVLFPTDLAHYLGRDVGKQGRGGRCAELIGHDV